MLNKRKQQRVSKTACLTAAAVTLFMNILPLPAFGSTFLREKEREFEVDKHIRYKTEEPASKEKTDVDPLENEDSLEEGFRNMDIFELGNYLLFAIDLGFDHYMDVLFCITVLTQEERATKRDIAQPPIKLPKLPIKESKSVISAVSNDDNHVKPPATPNATSIIANNATMEIILKIKNIR